MVVLLRGEAELASWPLVWDRPDLDVADELARLQLAARRVGCWIALRDAGVELLELLDLVGLSDVVNSVALREVGGEVKCREEAGVDEVVVPDDTVAGDLDDLDGERRMAAPPVHPVRAERGAAVRRRRHQT